MKKIRTFVAIPLPDSLLEQLDRLQRKLEPEVPPRSVRWVRSTGIHLTLKFLGDTPVGQLPEIKAALSAVARNAPSFTFSAEGLGCFPNLRRPRVLWVGIHEPTDRLAALQNAIEEVMEPLGYQPERRGFTPHLTLGRVRRRAGRSDARRLGELISATNVGKLGEVDVSSFAFIQSILKSTGAEYTRLEEFPLE
jgi:2'-5' RNA ligase